MPQSPISCQLKPIVEAFTIPLSRLVTARYPQSATVKLEAVLKILSWTVYSGDRFQPRWTRLQGQSKYDQYFRV